jgi:anti-sigma-K factor RskA
MTHETFREMLPLYVIGALDGDELYNFEKYVAENRERCHAELAEFQAIADQIAVAVPPAQPTPVVYERIAMAIEEGKRPTAAVAPAGPVPVATRDRQGFNPAAFLFRFVPWAAVALLVVMLVGKNNQIHTVEGLLQSMTASYNELLQKNDEQQKSLAKQQGGLTNLTARLDAQAKEFKEKMDQLTTANSQQQHDMEALRAANRELTDEKDAVTRAADQMREQLEKQTLQTAALQRKVDEQTGTVDFLMDPAIRVVPLLSDPKAPTKAVAKVYWNGAKKSGFLVVSNLAPVAQGQGKCLELWAICGTEAPVPAGIGWTDDSGSGRLQVKLSKDMTCIDKFAVTVERAGGVPAPEGSPILIGQ